MDYPTQRLQKFKDMEKLRAYLEHLRRLQRVDRTWRFSLSQIDAALQTLNKDLYLDRSSFV